MAYNRRNILLKIIDIQNYTLEQTKRGVTQKFIYDNCIFPTYRISLTTYYSYLATPAKAELKKIEQAEEVQKCQLKLF